MLKHFLKLDDITSDDLQLILQRGIELKANHKSGEIFQPLKNKTLVMIFEKASTRTRLSFEIGMTQLGGHSIFLSPEVSQLGRGESIEDSAKVISSMADAIMIRTFEHDKIEKFAKNSTVPIINALTDDYHPCQLLADMQTYYEQRGCIQGKTVLWIGDGNNMCNSYINAAKQYNFKLHIACPKGYEPLSSMTKNNTRITIFDNSMDAAKNVDLIVTDVWASMGQEKEQQQRLKDFAEFQVNEKLMCQAKPDALFMHCLPAHRDEEVTANIIDGSQSVVFQEAENRLHAQKALLEFLMQ